MTYFLEHIADSLHKEFGNTLNRHCLVFPNRRAGLYFLKYLAARIDKPVWSPSILTINELFRSYSSLQIAGNEILLFELYKVYSGLKKPAESFDEFYYWGDMLLNDFDDVDKYLVDGSLLFRNVLDIKNIDSQFGGLTDYQIEIIRRFWTNFNHNKPTGQKSGFINVWSVLAGIYEEFRNSLARKKIAYEGMIFREFAVNAEKYCESEDRWDLIHFIGFNALNECEKILMMGFKKAGKARFYWDYDNSYIHRENWNSAGFFLRDNLLKFGNDMPSGWSYDTMLSKKAPEVQRRVIDTSSDVAQVKLISQLIGGIDDISKTNAHHTAIVLADENLLMPVLTSLPETMEDINITMGYPLKQTLVYTLLRHLMDLQKNSTLNDGQAIFFYKDVVSILKHSLLSGFTDSAGKEIIKEIVVNNLSRIPSDRFSGSEFSLIFRKPLTPPELSEYLKDVLTLIASNDERKNRELKKNPVESGIRNEFIYRVVLSINRLETIVNSKEISFTTDTYIKILDRMLRMQSVPFSGEPLTGIQIMGILETRALDFKNLIMLSVNEGVLPAVSSGSSFIPFSLREAFGLPSVNHQESIYAYHFYRLMQRAENVTLVYNSNSEGLMSGEMSRFIIQMKYEDSLKPDFLDLSFIVKTNLAYQESIERTDSHSKQLAELYLNRNKIRSLSPSAINTWLGCRMRFYYQYVNRLKEPDSVSADIDPAMLGNILHDVMKNLYLPYTGSEISSEMLNLILKNREFLAGAIDNAVDEQFKAGRHDIASGNELIVRDVLRVYVDKILKSDRTIAPFVILNLEDSVVFNFPFFLNGSPVEISMGGKVDRVDNISGVTRIVDYKTGVVSESIGALEELFQDDRKKDSDGWLQTLLYCEAYLSQKPSGPVRPSIYSVRKMNGSALSDKLKIKSKSSGEAVIDNYETIRAEFIDRLRDLISIIFSGDEPFVKTKNARTKCVWCPYRILCSR